MPQTNLTARFVAALQATSTVEHWDTACPGLVLRAGPRSKSWGVVYTPDGGKKTRQAIGSFPDVSLEQARRKAREIIGGVATGDNPAEAIRLDRKAMTVAQLGALFVESDSKARKKTWKYDERFFNTDINPVIGGIKITALTRGDIRSVMDRLTQRGKMRSATLALRTMSKALGWAVERDLIPSNPAQSVKPAAPPVKRDRVLSDEEIAGFFDILFSPDVPIMPGMRDVFHLLALTGQRVGEVCGMHVGEIDLDKALWTIPSSRTKNGLTHIVPLSKQAKRIISRAMEQANTGGFLFFKTKTAPYQANAVSHAVRRLYKKAPVDWTPHDIRRTVATGMASIKVQPHIIEAVLNHISGFKSGVAGIYNRFAYADEKAAALQVWADHFDKLTAKAASARTTPTTPAKRGKLKLVA